jgi:Tannase and feruloyl esterase
LSYFEGCSGGGRQALKEAQEYPIDVDGIVAGAPALNWTHLAAQALWAAQATRMDPSSMIPR